MKEGQRKILAGILALIGLVISYYMYDLHQDQQLWGHLPLFQFTSLWGAIVLFWFPKFSLLSNKAQLMGASLISAVLLSLSFPPIGASFLIFVAFVPLLYVEDEISSRYKGIAKREAFKYSYLAFTFWNIFTTFWVANTAFVAGLFAIFLNAAFMTIPFVLFHVTKNRLNRKIGYASLIAYWISFEFIYLHQELSWTWLNLGNAFAAMPFLVQWYEYTGVLGGTMWALLANIWIYEAWKIYKQSEQKNRGEWFRVAAVLLIPAMFSIYLYVNYENKGIAKRVAVIQPNLEPHYVKFSLSKMEIAERFIDLSKKALSDSVDYLVFPETSYNRVRVENILNNPQIALTKKMIDQYPDLYWVSGISSRKIYVPGEEHGPAVREHRQGNKIYYWESANSAIQLKSGSKEIQFYNKSMLVPGAELLPYRKVFFFLEPLVEKLGGSMAGLARQEERGVFTAEDGLAIAPVICYESVYGEYVSDYVKKGANALFIITNDGWWDNTSGYRQHLAYARLRAIETRRSIARSANTGISAFINQRGDVRMATKYEEEAYRVDEVYFNDEMTSYTFYGDLIGRVLIFMSVLVFFNAIVRGVTERKKSLNPKIKR